MELIAVGSAFRKKERKENMKEERHLNEEKDLLGSSEELEPSEELEQIENSEEFQNEEEIILDDNINLSDSTALYLREISKFTLLSKTEEVEIAKKAKEGDKEARKKLVESNLRIVVKIAKKYRERGMPFLDLIQQGNLGLIKAVDKLDYTKGYRFTTYGKFWIKKYIEDGIADQVKLVRHPIHTVEAENKVKRALAELSQGSEEEITPEEIAKQTEFPVKKVEEILKLLLKEVSSLDVRVGEGKQETLIEFIPDDKPTTEEVVMDDSLKRELREAVNNYLDPRESKVIIQRFGLGDTEKQTLEAVGKELGVTRKRVHQIQNKALKKLKEVAQKKGLIEFLH